MAFCEFGVCGNIMIALHQIFQALDKDGSGSIDFNEFLVGIRVGFFERCKWPSSRDSPTKEGKWSSTEHSSNSTKTVLDLSSPMTWRESMTAPSIPRWDPVKWPRKRSSGTSWSLSETPTETSESRRLNGTITLRRSVRISTMMTISSYLWKMLGNLNEENGRIQSK